MKMLVTGGCGFIGSNFIRHVLAHKKDAEIVNIDKLTYCGNQENLKDISSDKRYSFVKGDICDAALVDRVVSDGVEQIVNFAAESHVDRSIKYPDDFIITNVYGLKVLLESAKKNKVAKFVQISTDEVYGSVGAGLSTENDPLRPNSPYSSTKAAGDLLALSYHSTYGLPVVITRSSNNFGPYQYPEKMIPLFVTNLLAGKKVPVYGDGAHVRDWLFVEDNCRAVSLIVEKGVPGEIYNVGGGHHLTNLELTKKILKIMGKKDDSISFVNDRPAHDRRYALDSDKIKKLGWKSSDDLDGLLQKTVEWYLKSDDWWKPLKDKAEIIAW